MEYLRNHEVVPAGAAEKKNGEVRRIRHFCGVRRDHLREHLTRPVPVARMPGLEVEEEAFGKLRIQLQLSR